MNYRYIRVWLWVLGGAVVVCAGLLPTPAVAAGKLAFNRDDGIWVANLDGSSPKKIAAGDWPDVTADGSKLTYTTSNVGKEGSRHIAVVDLATGTTKVLQSPPCDNCYGSRWSPDGTQLLFNYDLDNVWRIGLINADDTGFHEVVLPADKNSIYSSATWAADGQSFFAQDMESLYRIDLNGKFLNKWPMATVIPKSDMSSDEAIDASPDGKYLLMDAGMDEDVISGWEGALPAIWLFDLTTEKATRLTPHSLYAWHCHWLKATDSIMFVTTKTLKGDSLLYEMSTHGQGKDRKLLLKNADEPSCSR